MSATVFDSLILQQMVRSDLAHQHLIMMYGLPKVKDWKTPRKSPYLLPCARMSTENSLERDAGGGKWREGYGVQMGRGSWWILVGERSLGMGWERMGSVKGVTGCRWYVTLIACVWQWAVRSCSGWTDHESYQPTGVSTSTGREFLLRVMATLTICWCVTYGSGTTESTHVRCLDHTRSYRPAASSSAVSLNCSQLHSPKLLLRLPPLPNIAISVYMCVCLPVCLSVLSHVSKTASNFHQIFCTCCLWPWLDPPLMTMQYVTAGFVNCVVSHIMEPMGQNQRRRYISSSSPVGCTGGEVAVYDCRLVVRMRL